ncbi:Elongation of very long chain fatty acids protein 1 [Halotydeus destructor]|nr:Elongation of very long chain fatty acids protein 1 [Halotydeus destructor]
MIAFTSVLPAKFDYDYLSRGIWDNNGDPRVAHLVKGGPTTLVAVVMVYLAFVLHLGPSYMRNRKPFELRTAMKVYNLLNVALNLIFLAVSLYLTSWSADCWGCKDMGGQGDDLYSPMTRVIFLTCYMYLKIFDLLDTVFFVLRKKGNQVTPLHVSHHVIMPFTVFVGLKFIPNSSTLFTVIVNSFVHTVMYAYYYLASLGPQMQRHLWIKKYITVVQLIQFALVFSHAAHLLFNSSCSYPRWISTLEMMESLYFMYTFGKFYLRTYIQKNHKLQSKEN